MTRYLFLVFFLLSQPVAAHFEGDTPPPHCSLNYQDGSQVQDWQAMKGQVIYIDFWASWCPPCVKSFPFLNELNHDLKDKDLQVIGVNLDEKVTDAQEFIAKHPVDFAIVADASKQCAKGFEVMAMPTSYLIDRKGNIRHIHQGFRPGESEKLRALITQLVMEHP